MFCNDTNLSCLNLDFQLYILPHKKKVDRLHFNHYVHNVEVAVEYNFGFFLKDLSRDLLYSNDRH